MAPVIGYVDPLDEDMPSDKTVILTDRQLGRLLFIAAETGARFEREGTALDPLAWLFSPRTLFEGKTALDACQDREHFVRAIVLHGLSIGFDALPEDIDALVAEGDGSDCPAADGDHHSGRSVIRLSEFSPA